MTCAPTFTLVTATRERPDELARAYRSLLAQRYTDWEWIIVDDGSADAYSTRSPYAEDSRILTLRNERVRGKGYTRNRGVAAARGSWVGFLDDDDELLPNHFAALEKSIRQEGGRPAIYRSEYLIRRGRGHTLITPRSQIRSRDPWVRYLFGSANIFPWVVPRESARASAFTDFPVFQDAIYFLALALELDLIEVHEHTAVYNLYGASGSANALGVPERTAMLRQELAAIDYLFALPHPRIALYTAQGVRNVARAHRKLDYLAPGDPAKELYNGVLDALRECGSWSVYAYAAKRIALAMRERLHKRSSS